MGIICTECTNEYRTKRSMASHRKWHDTKYRAAFNKAMSGSNNPQWKGDAVGIGSLHEWIKTRLPASSCCRKCGNTGHIDLANISGAYKRELSDWQWLCRRCHMQADGRMDVFLYYGKQYQYRK